MNRLVLSFGLSLSFLFCQAAARAESLDALFIEGNKFYDAKDYQAAVEKFKQFTQTGKADKRLPEATARLGDSLLGLGMLMQATTTYEEWLRDFGTNDQAGDIRMNYARCFEAMGEWHKAIAQFKEYLKKNPKSPDLQLHIAEVYRDILNSPQDAVREYNDILVKVPDFPKKLELKMQLAELYRRQGGQIAQAKEIYTEIANEFPNSPEAQRSLKLAAWLSEDGGLKDYNAAMQAYRDYVKSYPQSADQYQVFMRMGKISRDQLNQPTNASDWFEKAMKLKPSASVLWEKCLALSTTEDQEKVIAAFNQLIQDYPDSAQAIEAYNILWKRQYSWGEAAEAVKILNQATQKYPNYIAFHYQLGHLYREDSKWDQAIAAYRKVDSLEPGYNKGEIYDFMLDCYMQKKDGAGAEALLKEVLANFPQNEDLSAKALWSLATKVYEPQNKLAEAMATYKVLLTDYPSHLYSEVNHSTANLFSLAEKQNQLAQAIADIQAISKKHPDNSNIRFAQAEIVLRLTAMGEHDKAIAYADQMLLDDDYDAAAARALIHQGMAYRAKGNVKGQMETFTRLARSKRSPRATAVRSEIEALSSNVFPVLTEDAAYQRNELVAWSSKVVPFDEGDKFTTIGDHSNAGEWLTGTVEGWKASKIGDSFDVKKDYVWLVTQFDASGLRVGKEEAGEESEAVTKYLLKFEKVNGTSYLFVDGQMVKKNTSYAPFQVKIQSKKAEGKITIALLIQGDRTGSAGIEKSASALTPRAASQENTLLVGLAYQLAGEYADALNYYTQYVKKADAGAREEVKVLQNRIHAEKQDLEALASNAPAAPSLEYQLLIAELYQLTNKGDRSVQALEKAAGEFSKSRGVKVALARAYEKNGMHKQAIQTWQSILEQWPDAGNIETYRRYLVWYAANSARDVSLARQLATSYNQPPSQYWLQTLGDLYFDQLPKDYNQAMSWYFQAYNTAQDADKWYLASRVFDSTVANQNIPRAIQFADQFWAKKNPGHSKTPLMVYKIGRAYHDAGNHPKALEYYKIVQDQYPFSEAATRAVHDAIELPGGESMALLEKWVQTNAGNPDAAQMYWALAQQHEKQKQQDKALPLYEKIWSDFPDQDPLNFKSASRLAALLYASDDAAKKARAVALLEQILERFATKPDPEIKQTWSTLSSHYRSTDPAKFVAHNQRLAATFPGQPAALNAQMAINAYLQEQNQHLDSAIQMQRTIHNMPRNNGQWWDKIVEVGLARVNVKRYGEASIIFKSLLKRNEGFDRAKTQDVEKYMADALSKSGTMVATVDPNKPEAGILWGNIFANAGEDELAWIKYKENEQIFPTYQHLVSPAYIRVIVNNQLVDKKVREAINICRKFMITNANAAHLQDSDKAQVQLLLGDAYFRDERYEIARDEYTTVISMWPNTMESIDARFKVGETLVAQKIFAKAEEIFEDLSSYKNEEVSARAHLMLGIAFHTQGEMDKAEDKFKEVLALMPKNETADMIMYRLGMVYQTTKKYREALDTLRLIGAYGGQSKRVVAPGTALRIRLSDRNLQIVKGNSSVPIVVKAASGDEEIVQLSRSFAGPGLYVASIDTELGEAKPGDRKLQVIGKDIITYDYHDDFKKLIVVIEGEEKPTISVASDGELKFSSTEIVDEVEQEVNADMFRKEEEEREEFRTGKQIAPGNFCYVQVTDGDHDLTNGADKTPVTVESTSGDSVRVMLEETGPHTGVFRGRVKTGLKPADAIASDSSEGNDPRFAVDGDKTARTSWIGMMDGRSPKWLLVDLKEVKTIDKIEYHRGEGVAAGDERSIIRYAIDVAKKKDEWYPVAANPATSAPMRSLKLMDDSDAQPADPRVLSLSKLPFISDGNLKTVWRGRVKTDVKAKWAIDFDLGQITTLSKLVLTDADPANAIQEFAMFTEENPGIRPVGDKGWKFHPDSLKNKKSNTFISLFQARYFRIVINKTNGDHPEIADIDLIPQLDAKETMTADGLGNTITFQPVEARFVRMTINEFRGDAPALSHFGVSGGGKQFIPVEGLDVHSLASNDTLEVSPGDTITASYSDEVNVDPGTPKVYQETLEATYFNGKIQCIRNEFIEDQAGNRRKEELKVARVNVAGKEERVIIQITEYDADKTDGIDKLPLAVLSRSTGNKLNLIATETGPFTGIFTKELDLTTEQAAPGALQVVDGDVIQIAFVDVENTDPGNKTERQFELEETLPTDGSVEIVSQLGTMAADKPDQRPVKLITIEDALVVQVIDKDRALDSGSKVIVDLETRPGGDTARIECEIEDLEAGLFTGRIKLALGDKNSPDELVEGASFQSEFSDASDNSSAASRRKKEQQVMIPVLNVMGQDIIYANYIDEFPKSSNEKSIRRATARIITNGVVGFFDDEYEAETDLAHLGDKIFIKIEDGDADTTEERDVLEVLITSSLGDKATLKVTETLSHSGIFTTSVQLIASAKADPDNDVFEADFGDEIKITYVDVRNLDRDETGKQVGAAQREASAKIVVGTDGALTAFGKKYPDNEIAIETQFHVGECYYYLGKQHIELKDKKLGVRELKEGQEILHDLMINFPGSKTVDQAAYLLANLAQEQEEYHEAIEVYGRIVMDWPKSLIAPDAQYKTGICHEKMDDMDKAMEEYVRLAYKFPDSLLVGDAMIRIGLYFFNKKNYPVAISVFNKFTEKFPEHEQVQKVSFKMGLCFILGEQYTEAGDHFKAFVDKYEGDLKPAALYWAGDAYLKANEALKAYQMFKRVIWDFPEEKWAKFARGRLTAPVFDRISEQE
ncbi:MAG: tetratricopeptide repeat protein [Planctomycetota bacterium]|nr:tetratricopeptide repeat protein [Planctomycetota bacterium]